MGAAARRAADSLPRGTDRAARAQADRTTGRRGRGAVRAGAQRDTMRRLPVSAVAALEDLIAIPTRTARLGPPERAASCRLIPPPHRAGLIYTSVDASLAAPP